MKKKMIISSILLSGGLFFAGQAIGQFQTMDQKLQEQQAERSGTGINSNEGALTTARPDSSTRQDTTVSGTDRQRSQERTEQQLQDTDQQQRQQQFGVSPQFDNRDELQSRQRPTQGRSDDQPGESSDMTREQGSSAIQGTGQSGSMQSGPGASGGGIGGSGGSGGSAGSGGSGGQ